jgi:hypothetical protein
VVVAHDPDAEVPLLIAAVRDELLDRPWEWPGRHWPEYPALIGGRDVRAGGTWLAVDPGDGGAPPRVGAVLNGHPPAAPPEPLPPGAVRPTRGRLPLRAAAGGGLGLGPRDLRHHESFHLLAAEPAGAVLYGWDGRDLTERPVPPGVSVIVNTGLDPDDPRARAHAPRFAAARPDTGRAALRTATAVGELWGEWPDLLDAAARGPARSVSGGDPSSLTARVDLGDGRLWATSSMSLVACAPGGLRYAFTAAPGDPAAWRMVR